MERACQITSCGYESLIRGNVGNFCYVEVDEGRWRVCVCVCVCACVRVCVEEFCG